MFWWSLLAHSSVDCPRPVIMSRPLVPLLRWHLSHPHGVTADSEERYSSLHEAVGIHQLLCPWVSMPLVKSVRLVQRKQTLHSFQSLYPYRLSFVLWKTEPCHCTGVSWLNLAVNSLPAFRILFSSTTKPISASVRRFWTPQHRHSCFVQPCSDSLKGNRKQMKRLEAKTSIERVSGVVTGYCTSREAEIMSN